MFILMMFSMLSESLCLTRLGHITYVCPARVNDYVEFFEEIDMLCALFACRKEELSKWVWAMNEGGHPSLELILGFWKNGSYPGLLGTNGSMGQICLIL